MFRSSSRSLTVLSRHRRASHEEADPVGLRTIVEECQCHEIRRPVLCVIVAVIVAIWSTVSLLSTYTDAAVFSSLKSTVQTVMGYVDMAGSLTSALVCVALAAVAVPGAFTFARLSRRLKTICVIAAAVLAWSASSRPFTNGQFPVEAVNWNPPSVLGDQRTAWYWMYEVLRFCGFWAILSLMVGMLIVAVARHGDAMSHLPKPGGEVGTITSLVNDAARRFWSGCSVTKRVFLQLRTRNVAVLAAIMTVCWMPWLVLMYPTNIGPDTVAQLVWGRTHHAWDPSSRQDLPSQYWMSDHHPWLDTVIYTAFDEFGLKLGNENYGLWLLAIVQTIAITLSIAALICYLGSFMNVSWRLCFVFMVFCCLMPVYGRFMTLVMKDTTFLPFFIGWSVLFMELLRRIRNEIRITPGFLAAFIALALLSGLTKKTGLYVILACMFIVFIVMKKRWITVLVTILMLVATIGVNAVATPVLHIAHAGKQEMFGVPSQQIAALRIHHEDSLSDGDRQAIEQVLTCPVSQMQELYDPLFSDPIKDNCFNRDASLGQITSFMMVWMKQGVRHPITYIDAVPWISDPFVMGAKYSNGYYVRTGWSDKGGIEILQTWATGERAPLQRIAEMVYSTLAKMPVIGFALTEAVYVCWLPVLAIALCAAMRRWRNLLYMLPIIFNIFIIFISPARQMRYTLTIVFMAVLIVAVPFIQDDAQRQLVDKIKTER